MAKELTRIQEEYLDWLLLPSELKVPHTNQEWAAEHNLTPNTLTNWKKLPMFAERWKDGIKGMAVSPERTQMLLDSLFKKGINGDVKSAQLYLQATNQMPNPRQEINIKSDNARELSDGELEALIAQYAQTEKKKRDDEVKDVEKDLTKLKKVIKDAP
jgi:hypothetical protein